MLLYKEFVELIENMSLVINPSYAGVLRGEVEFVKASTPDLSDMEAERKATLRFSQYAVEGAVVESVLLNWIYLNSEYPVVQVWKKLTFMSSIPTLFYVDNEAVKNI